MKCQECDKEIEPFVKFCPECGNNLMNIQNSKKEDDDNEDGGLAEIIGNFISKIFG